MPRTPKFPELAVTSCEFARTTARQAHSHKTRQKNELTAEIVSGGVSSDNAPQGSSDFGGTEAANPYAYTSGL
ncbi:hypothetical protein AWZ03_002406 [Drosophila navojoa]|uniref:Uncharacterized protein n=1 Tax=Drosophila navojoa TaxID=7232 RepID=A0A484BR80_DRONA|nr:hypothetical protein AWZ03_002406 [Drosophila navojoa]